MSHPRAPYTPIAEPALGHQRTMSPAEREAEITEMLAETDALCGLSDEEREARRQRVLSRPAGRYKMPSPEAQALFSEARLGQECGLWLQSFNRLAYDVFFHIPNGGLRTAVESAGFKAQHAKAGVPDYFLATGGQGYGGLFIELKTQTGAVKREQKAWHERLRQQGYRVEVIRSLPEFIDLLTEYLS